MIKRPWKRFFSHIIDSILLFIFFAITHPIFGIGEVITDENGWFYNLSNFELVLAYFIYFGFFAIALKGKTPGKALFKLEYFDKEGHPLSHSKIIIRELVKVPLLIIGLISFITMHARQDGEAIHDLLLKTNVGNKKIVEIEKEVI